MEEVEFHCEPPTNVPTLVMAVGGWVDAGDAATGALRYLWWPSPLVCPAQL